MPQMGQASDLGRVGSAGVRAVIDAYQYACPAGQRYAYINFPHSTAVSPVKYMLILQEGQRCWLDVVCRSRDWTFVGVRPGEVEFVSGAAQLLPSKIGKANNTSTSLTI